MTVENPEAPQPLRAEDPPTKNATPAAAADEKSQPQDTTKDAVKPTEVTAPPDTPAQDTTKDIVEPTKPTAPSSTPAQDTTKVAKPTEATAPSTPAQGTGTEEKKLTGAELKRRAKEEKAARREKVKQTKVVPAAGPAPTAQPSSSPAQKQNANAPATKVKGKPQEGNQQPASGKGAGKQAAAAPAPVPANTLPSAKNPRAGIPEDFAHLPMARRVDYTQADKDVHPDVLVLGQKMGSFAITDSMSRLYATLQCLKTIIQCYETPTGHTISRHFTPHVLNPQIEYLAACRPLCVSMGNAIRWLKKQVANMDPDLPEDEAKELLYEAIDAFARERVGLADVVITRAAAERINDGDRVVTFGHHAFVEQAIRKATEEDGKEFTLIIVDDAHEPVGRDFATRISALEGLDVTYCPDLGSLQWALDDASVVLVGAEAMFSNGATYAAAGTCDVAVAAHAHQVDVIALCASVGVSERLAIDSLSHNEIDPEHCTEDDFRLMFDTTPPRYVGEVMTEIGNTRPTGVPAVLSKLEDL